MDDPEELRAEIEHLRTLASFTADPEVLAEIGTLIRELHRRIRAIDGPRKGHAPTGTGDAVGGVG
jgi:hypothetical protein